jgi:hypothetical protein
VAPVLALSAGADRVVPCALPAAGLRRQIKIYHIYSHQDKNM